MLSHVGTVRSSHKTLSLYLSEKAKSLANKMEMCTGKYINFLSFAFIWCCSG